MAVLTALPPDALLCLLNHVVAVSNTGQLLKLALACRQYLELIAHADWFWQQQSAALGWIRTGVEHPPRTSPPVPFFGHTILSNKQQQHSSSEAAHIELKPLVAAAAGAKLVHSGDSVSRLWFEYYCLRMSCRCRLRLLMRKYIPFLNIQSRLAMQAGASIQELEAAETALGMKLPWELWELYRFRAGQTPGIGVSFTEGCRCLGLHELSIAALSGANQLSLAPERPPTQQQQLAAVEAQLPELSCNPSLSHLAHAHHHQHDWQQQQQQHQQQSTLDPGWGQLGTSSLSNSSSSTAGQAAAAGVDSDLRAVVFLSNIMGSVEYAVTANSAVYLRRGFTSRRVAANLTGFIQHLLA